MGPFEYVFLFVGAIVLLIYTTLTVIKLKEQNRLIRNQSREIAEKNRILNQQNQTLTQINLEKNQIIGVVSHDLKSPFNRVFALVNLIKMEADNLTPRQEEYLDRIRNVISESLSLIRNLLDIRAIEDKGIDIKPEYIDVVKLVSTLVKSYEAIMSKKEITIVWENQMAQSVWHTDKQYVGRMVENLFSNAVKFTRKGGSIKVRLVGDSGRFGVRIFDQGPGIPEEEWSLLFQKFQVLSPQATGGENSTGLGLSIVKSLVERLGGEVIFNSQVGVGSEFGFVLPEIKAEEKEREDPQSSPVFFQSPKK